MIDTAYRRYPNLDWRFIDAAAVPAAPTAAVVGRGAHPPLSRPC
ncbi:hypothetical protein [Kushneria aurantia]|uniref:Uncharacterized protein n=1 Tax=Kushneria aurantia TaxID=504092 RepID=A0ABV6G535_9GAMM|nr:hypothetical protein [Kushneria aurantia]